MITRPQEVRAPRPRPRALDGESVEDRAERLITGDNSLVFNPWRRAAVIDATSLRFPVGVEVTNTSFALDFNANFGLLWDNAELLELPSQAIAGGKVVPVSVSERRGRQLEVWTDDGDVTAQAVNASELDRRAKERADREAADNKPGFGLGDFGKGLIDAQMFGVLAAVVIVVIVGLQLAKSWDGALPAPGVNL